MFFSRSSEFSTDGFCRFLVIGLIALSVLNRVRIVQSANILGIFTLPAKSHYAFDESVMRSLHAAGHNVTILCTPELIRYKSEDNYTIIPVQMPSMHDLLKSPINTTADGSTKEIASISFKDMFKYAKYTVEKICENLIELPFLKQLLKGESTQQFDVLLTETMSNSICFALIVEKLKMPAILMGAFPYFYIVDDLMGNPNNPAVVPSEFVFLPTKMNFFQRVKNVLATIGGRSMLWLLSKFISVSPEVRDDWAKMSSEKGFSLYFQNGHHSLMSRPLVPAIVDIGGIHLQPAKTLPQNIQKFMDEADAGVILFAMGTLTPTTNLSPELMATFNKAFARIPQRVLWKYEYTGYDLPENVMILDWLPQRDILAHKNTKAFITHCGINSIYEAIYEAVPLIMVPINGDQFPNAASIEERGAGIYLNAVSSTEDDILAAINAVVNHTRYKNGMKKLSQIFKDRPLSPQQSVVYWTEYVIRHKGAYHLRTAAFNMPLYQYLLLDVIGFILIILVSTILVIKFALRLLIAKICTAKAAKSNATEKKSRYSKLSKKNR